MLFSATSKVALHGFYDARNVYHFAYGKSNKVADSIKQFFWQVDTKRDSNIVGSHVSQTRMLEYAPDEIPHPFDALYIFAKNILFKNPESVEKAIIFVKRTMLADNFARRLNFYGFSSVSVHGLVLRID